MRTFGLTGGIASGKSTVSAMFRDLGASILDADHLAREVVAPGTEALEEIGRRFPGVVTPEGALDRAALGMRVFTSEGERAALNAIVHPRIQALALERSQREAALGTQVLLYDAALLIENGLHERMEGVLLVVVPPELQRSRLMARDGLSASAADARLASQWPLAKKLPYATWTLDNSGDLENTRSQVRAIWPSLLPRP